MHIGQILDWEKVIILVGFHWKVEFSLWQCEFKMTTFIALLSSCVQRSIISLCHK